MGSSSNYMRKIASTTPDGKVLPLAISLSILDINMAMPCTDDRRAVLSRYQTEPGTEVSSATERLAIADCDCLNSLIKLEPVFTEAHDESCIL
jgi:hypothetical protein